MKRPIQCEITPPSSFIKPQLCKYKRVKICGKKLYTLINYIVDNLIIIREITVVFNDVFFKELLVKIMCKTLDLSFQVARFDLFG